ncbi:hypothetical protein ACSQ67_005174 [Phaseolus vulgaris]|uniref:OVATE domain-containing protein n=1 Tax=Phaseolus vulgaris TaxID=3885 RepID=V7CSS9_PHAVU|nr:hypothetical protein PHAVU_002G313100g [Phaseolus vulgaris]ESW32330.1 hypothetical protein PHAVU_002G313100g [Phaseolus vulgaris]
MPERGIAFIIQNKKLKNLSWLLFFYHLYSQNTSLSDHSLTPTSPSVCPFMHQSTQHHKILLIHRINTITVITSPMQLGSSISNTIKFLHKTIQNFKSCFSPGYQKLPKTPPQNHVSGLDNNNPCFEDLEKFYSDFTKQWDSEKEKKKKGKEVPDERFIGLNNARREQKMNDETEKTEECVKKKTKGLTNERMKEKDSSLNVMRGRRGNGNYLRMEKKLREMEMLEKSDVDYVLDIEEVLHYYSRLTCPMYLQIVDKFLMEMCSEFLNSGLK